MKFSAWLGAGEWARSRARDSVLKREVAIKVLPSFVSQDPDRLHRFEQEAEAAAALNHPNILVVHQFDIFQGAPYLVSELLEGGTLRQLLQHGLMISPDGKYLYFTTGGADPSVARIRFSDQKMETITSLKDFHRVINERSTQINVAPDGSPIFTRDTGYQEIYALNIKWP